MGAMAMRRPTGHASLVIVTAALWACATTADRICTYVCIHNNHPSCGECHPTNIHCMGGALLRFWETSPERTTLITALYKACFVV